MDNYSQVPIIQCCYSTTIELLKLTALYPKNFRSTLGTRTAANASELLTNVIKTNFMREHSDRLQSMEQLQTQLFTLGIEVRMAKDLKIISIGQHADLHERLADIRRQLNGWKSWSESHC